MAKPEGVRLLARADDLGSFHSANRAILEAYRNGIVRNASLLAVAAHFEEAATMVRDEPGLCLGLHATITAEWDNVRWPPVLSPEQVPALVDEQGHLVRHPGEAQEQGVTAEQVLLEVEAQLGRARQAGLNIEYLDTHMGFSWLEGVHEGLAALCKREGLIYHNALDCFERVGGAHADSGDPIASLASGIRALGAGTYLLVAHPAYDDAEMREVRLAEQPPGEIAREREVERRLFTDPSILEAVADRAIELVRYSDL